MGPEERTENVGGDLIHAYQPRVTVVHKVRAEPRRGEDVGRETLWQAILYEVQRMVKARHLEHGQVVQPARGGGKDIGDALEGLDVWLERVGREVRCQGAEEEVGDVFVNEDVCREAGGAGECVGRVSRGDGDGERLGGAIECGGDGRRVGQGLAVGE